MGEDTTRTKVDTDVLIVGAGPTGLVLALWLTRLGVRVRIIDKAAQPGTTSRALVVHARTLELYSQLGIAGDVIEHGFKFAAANLWVRGKQAGRIVLGDIGTGLSPFPYMLIHPQDEHERLLIQCLAGMGVAVERRTEMTGCDDRTTHVLARLSGPEGVAGECTAAYVAGCDGAHSTLRELLGAGFPGGTYARMFYVADVEARGPVMNHELHVALDDVDFLAVFPLAGEGRARLIGTLLDAARETTAAPVWQDVSGRMLERMRVEVASVNWFSSYHVHHRVARHFSYGRAFLLGDAAHIHSPVGGQGMNTGIGDAVNLGWKLAAVLRGCAHPRLLDTYEPERIAFAQRLVATTDRAFSLVTSDGPLARLVRLHVVPRLVPALLGLTPVRRFMFRTVSQIMLNYRGCELNAGRAGDVHGGDRLPWAGYADTDNRAEDNFLSLAALEWQVHVYGRASVELEELCMHRGIKLETFAWAPNAAQAGLIRDAAYLIRPDGYVAIADPKADAGRMASYLDAWHLRPFANCPDEAAR